MFGRLKAVTAMVCATLVSTSLIAMANEGPITSQPYVDYYGIHKAHEQGYAGQGATIAIIDGLVDTSVPELAGTDIEVLAECNPSDPAIKKSDHATAIASMLVSPAYGWAPKAKLIAYATNSSHDNAKNEQDSDAVKCALNDSWALADAINRKVDIISISIEARESDPRWHVLIHAAAQKGIIVVMASGNTGKENPKNNNSYNGSVSVGSHDADRQRSSFTTYGQGLTLLAFGGPFSLRRANDNGRLTQIEDDVDGTSFSTPMVAGALALGKSKWPTATGNQLLRAMLDTAAPCEGDPEKRFCGYGVLSLGAFAQSDPLSKEDSNPLMEKSSYGLELLEAEQTRLQPGTVALYTNYDDYIYRGSSAPCSDYPQGTNPQSRCQFGSSPIFMKNVETFEKTHHLTPAH